MQTVEDVLRYLLPDGTPPRATNRATLNWERCPPWPPDVFAVAATIISRSGCYLNRRYNRYDGESFCSDAYRARVTAIGGRWRRRATLPRGVQALWRALVADPDRKQLAKLEQSVTDAAMELLAIADEAASGIGFEFSTPPVNHFADLFQDELAKTIARAMKRSDGSQDPPILKNLPHSCCLWISPEAACVQPKTRTAQVGCTLRSLSHNLALLPHKREVLTHWFPGPNDKRAQDQELNLLVVPFPYEVPQHSFRATGHACPGAAEFFRLDQVWLRTPTGRRIGGDDLSRFVLDLIDQSPARIDGVILPELALDLPIMNRLALTLMDRPNAPQFLIGGIRTERAGRVHNEVYTALLGRKRMAWTQSKHHRWRLERGQLAMYDLTGLDWEKRWWEDIDLCGQDGLREAMFWQFRHGAILGALVCEDLARVEPVHSAFRAVGPNLVVALLMDGPQLERRWAGKCSTALSEDPGSSVLTLTSLGLVRRAERVEGGSYKIALWRDGSGLAQELELPKGAHALLLQCAVQDEENWTLDGRSDQGTSVRITLRRTTDVVLRHPPSWANYLPIRKDGGRRQSGGAKAPRGAKMIR